MKKFLTVLLVIAVMFTFSFGTAFAADPVSGGTLTPQQTLDKAYEEAKTNLAAVKTATVEKLAAEYAQTLGCAEANHNPKIHTGVNNFQVVISKSVYAQVAEKIYSDYMEVLAIKYAELSKGSDENKTAAKLAEAISGATYGDLAGKAYEDVNTVNDFTALLVSTSDNTYLGETLRLELNNYKEEVKTELSKIDLSLYSDKVMDSDDPYAVTYKQLAEKTKAEWIAAADDVSVTSDATQGDIIQALCELNCMIKSDKITGKITYTNEKGQTVNVTYRFADNAVLGYNSTPLVISDSLKDEATKNEAIIASKKATIASNAALYYNNYVTNNFNNKALLATAKKVADAYVEIMNCRVENATNPASVATPGVKAGTVENGKSYLDIKKIYDDAAEEAAVLKVMVDATGKLLYKAGKIDENLEAAKVEIYDGDADYSYNLTAGARNIEDDVEWTKAKAIAAAEDERDGILYQADGTANYYEPEQAKIVAKYDELIAKINAATTTAQVDAISKVVNLAGIKDKSGVNNAVKALSKFDTEYTKLENYVKYLNGDTKEWQEGYKAMMSKDELAKFYAKNGARTNEEIVALIDKAKSECDAIKTSKEIKDAKKAVEDQVAALPAYITVAEKEAVKAAWTAADDLGIALDNQAKLNNAVLQLKNAEDAAIDKMVKALPAKDKVTTADKDAVKAIADAVNAYESETMYKADDKFAVYDQKDLVNEYKGLVRDAAKAEVVAIIAALPENASKAQIEAARAAYDAFVTEYQDALKKYDAKNEIVNLEKLTYAEAQLAAAEIKAVESLKLKASSKATKGAITVTWKVTGDAEAADGYQLYKSTKAQKGYKKCITTTKTSFKNTKNLKKGTRYYYKVRAYKVVDGKTYYSDWSNKANRIAK